MPKKIEGEQSLNHSAGQIGHVLEAEPIFAHEILDEPSRSFGQTDVGGPFHGPNCVNVVGSIEIEPAAKFRNQNVRTALDEPVQAALAELMPLRHLTARSRPSDSAGPDSILGLGRRSPRPDIPVLRSRVLLSLQAEALRLGKDLIPDRQVGVHLYRRARRRGHAQELSDQPLDVARVRLVSGRTRIANRDDAVDSTMPFDEGVDLLAALASATRDDEQLAPIDRVAELLSRRLSVRILQRPLH